MTALASANIRVDRMLSQVAYLAMSFPDLKANQTYQQLTGQLDGIETEVLQRR